MAEVQERLLGPAKTQFGGFANMLCTKVLLRVFFLARVVCRVVPRSRTSKTRALLLLLSVYADHTFPLLKLYRFMKIRKKKKEKMLFRLGNG